MFNSLLKAVFLDAPSVIDSAWRHAEYALNRECTYRPGNPDPIDPRPGWQKPPFWLFAITVFFVSYGPTWGGLCAIAPGWLIDGARYVTGTAIIGAFLWLGSRLGFRLRGVIQRHFGRIVGMGGTRKIPFARTAGTYVVVSLPLLALVAAGVAGGGYLLLPSDRSGCGVQDVHALAIVRLLLCLAAIGAFWLVTRAWPGRVTRQVVAQAGIVVLLALIQWFVLAGEDGREARDLPYRHVFLVWAPLMLVVAALAPWAANRAFHGRRAVLPAQLQGLRSQFAQSELFVSERANPTLTRRRIWSAIIYGPASNLMHLLLIPALVALVVNSDWLYGSTGAAFVFSFLLLAWGKVSERWDQLNIYIERWFLQGVPLLVSGLVILLAVLRLTRFGYISTLLDVIPFGMVFGLIAMVYVLFWLVEYWFSRVAAAHLLGVLGDVSQSLWIAYPFRQGSGAPAPDVAAASRFVASHGTGRFAVIGTFERSPGVFERAFHTYYLSELFATLGAQGRQSIDPEWITDIRERLGLYYFRLNALMAVVTVALGVVYYRAQFTSNTIAPVVSASVSQAAGGNADLATLLKAPADPRAPVRPAVVVIGSGGGTRAALYTASVLHGLHRLGVARDVVFESGVSGGGVALAYFAASRDRLTAARGTGSVAPCPARGDPVRSVDQEWGCFMKRVTSPFIEDVLNGATEWRIFTTTALSQLLVESFDKHLFDGGPTLASVAATPLILNTAVVGHPAEESMALTRTIDPTTKCEELEQPFRLMNGGRLAFTNLRDTGAFPERGAIVPDVRLPYQLVTDGTVRLSQAAALNANFPPVFPNARVRLSGGVDSRCAFRSYYVTDGGAQENLGLISALYGLESALKTLPDGMRLRPLHIVIAEASAVTYDYSQDRGISAPGGARERLAGGLTNALIARVGAELERVTGKTGGLQFHYLGMPLAFRSRGGFGTHWLYAKAFDLNDPRPRMPPPGISASLWPGVTSKPVRIGRTEMEALWLGLHDPARPFCDASFKAPADRVQAQICGEVSERPDGRDLHLGQWRHLVETMKPYQAQ